MRRLMSNPIPAVVAGRSVRSVTVSGPADAGLPLYAQAAIVGVFFALWMASAIAAGIWLLYRDFSVAVAGWFIVSGPCFLAGFLAWCVSPAGRYIQSVTFDNDPPPSADADSVPRVVPVVSGGEIVSQVDLTPRRSRSIAGLTLSGRDVSKILSWVQSGELTLRRNTSSAGHGLDALPDFVASGPNYGRLRAALEKEGYIETGRWTDLGISWLRGGA